MAEARKKERKKERKRWDVEAGTRGEMHGKEGEKFPKVGGTRSDLERKGVLIRIFRLFSYRWTDGFHVFHYQAFYFLNA